MADKYVTPQMITDEGQPTPRMFAAPVTLIAYAAVVFDAAVVLNYAGIMNAAIWIDVGGLYAVALGDC